MKMKILILIAIFIGCQAFLNGEDTGKRSPSILIVTLIRNKAKILPYFFSYLENLNYPKNRLGLWIHSDHNEDNSIEIINIWLNKTSKFYNHIHFEFDHTETYNDEGNKYKWTDERFLNIINLKERALKDAHKLWSDFVFFLDADVLLTNINTLTDLTSLNLPIVSPMLKSVGLYSNFWCAMTEDYYYKRTDLYKTILDRKETGSFDVAMIHSAVLINLNFVKTTLLTFNREKLLLLQSDSDSLNTPIYQGPIDDIIIFAISVLNSGLKMHVNNEYECGYIMQPPEEDHDLYQEYNHFLNLRIIIINDLGVDFPIKKEFHNLIDDVEKHTLTLDHIYMINLERRPERRTKMELIFKEFGLDVELFLAVDGKNLNVERLKSMGISLLPNFTDPYHGRTMTMGEVGCFLSHYTIWEKIVENKYNEVLILEDDINFEPYFQESALQFLDEIRAFEDWDLLYFGRKPINKEDDEKTIIRPEYSYWTIGYVISLKGAQKLIRNEPLKKLIPIDEFLPIMYDRHPIESLKLTFENRNLQAFSVKPLIIYPTHYVGDENYISDTEDSEIVLPTIKSIGDTTYLNEDTFKAAAVKQAASFFGQEDTVKSAVRNEL